jgi:hypothetical protein
MLFKYSQLTNLDRVFPAKVELIIHAHSVQRGVTQFKSIERNGAWPTVMFNALRKKALAAATSRVRLKRTPLSFPVGPRHDRGTSIYRAP